MENTPTLNDLYTQYKEGLLKRKPFEGRIFNIILDDIHRFNLYRWDRDDCGDYLSWLYPRLSRAIDSYRETGASFENYINTVVHMAAKEYRSRQAGNHSTEYAAWAVRLEDSAVCQEEPDYDCQEEPVLVDPKPVRNPRQVLFLLLKCYFFVSDDFLDRLAPKLGIERDVLKHMVERLRELRSRQDIAMRMLRERVNCQFYRCIVYEKRLAVLPENSVIALKMQTRLEKARRRLQSMRKRLAKMRPGATNLQIAELVGVTKGTVDASLYALKKQWNNNSNEIILN